MTRAHDHSPIRQRREELGLMVTELAALIERSPAFISVVEHGFVPSQPRRRNQIASALSTTPEVLWPEEYA